MIAWSTGVIGLLAVCFALFALYKHHETRRKNRALVRQIDEAMAYKERYEALLSPQILDTPKGGNAEDTTDTDLFAQIHDTIVREQLYLNPTCDRQMLIDRFRRSALVPPLPRAAAIHRCRPISTTCGWNMPTSCCLTNPVLTLGKWRGRVVSAAGNILATASSCATA